MTSDSGEIQGELLREDTAKGKALGSAREIFDEHR